MNSKNLNEADFLYETTAGAALPFVKSVSDIASSSDSIKKIEGVFSGTLAYLFNSYDASMPFSELVNDALQQGFTEPDPRDDLSGMDVDRKLVILAREMGLDMKVNDIHVESLVDPNHLSLSVNEYLEAMSSGDQAMNDRYQNAFENNEFPATKNALCKDWCYYKPICPLFNKEAPSTDKLRETVEKIAEINETLDALEMFENQDELPDSSPLKNININELKDLNIDFLSYDIKFINDAIVTEAKNKKIPIVTWTINSIEKFEEAHVKADNIIFEKIDLSNLLK